MDLYKWDYVVDASKTISGMITPTQAKVIKEAKTYACAFRQCFLRGGLRSNGSGHAMAVVGYVAMYNIYSNAKKYLLVVWNG